MRTPTRLATTVPQKAAQRTGVSKSPSHGSSVCQLKIISGLIPLVDHGNLAEPMQLHSEGERNTTPRHGSVQMRLAD
jgi:hypothetical protein